MMPYPKKYNAGEKARMKKTSGSGGTPAAKKAAALKKAKAKKK